ncbi:MAG: hypothetical protein QOD41_1119, partial [Cryptosporangiaceae bacterium]|nr:hypothetical protein [Cryptosporangiaceae bacterium]
MHARALTGWLGCILAISGCTTPNGDENPQPQLDPLPTMAA